MNEEMNECFILYVNLLKNALSQPPDSLIVAAVASVDDTVPVSSAAPPVQLCVPLPSLPPPHTALLPLPLHPAQLAEQAAVVHLEFSGVYRT
jgi:hypothetical protein